MDRVKKQNVIVILLALLACVGMVSCGDGDEESFIVGKPSNIFSNVSPKKVGKYSIYYDEQGRVSMVAENGRYPPTQNGDIRSLFMLFTLMAMQN